MANNVFSNDGSFMAQFLAQQAAGAVPGASAPTAAGAAPGACPGGSCDRTKQRTRAAHFRARVAVRAGHVFPRCVQPLARLMRPCTDADVLSLQSSTRASAGHRTRRQQRPHACSLRRRPARRLVRSESLSRLTRPSLQRPGRCLLGQVVQTQTWTAKRSTPRPLTTPPRIAETELVESAWGKKYKAGFVPKSSHVGNLLPADEMAKYTSLLPGRGGAAEKKEEKDKTVLDSSNTGYKLLSKMGWKAGKGLGAKEDGKVAPVGAEKGASDKSGAAAGSAHGVGSQHTWDLDGSEDVFEQYRKRMMLGYRHRPNPNGNPRKLYY